MWAPFPDLVMPMLPVKSISFCVLSLLSFYLFIYLLERTSFVFILGGFDINLRSLNPGSHVKRVDLYQLNEIPNYY